jgi:type I restriction enzyme R subunit
MISGRIARHGDDPVFRALGERLQKLKEKYEHGQQASLDFLRELLELARDTVAAEKAVEEAPREEKGKAALTELSESVKDAETPSCSNEPTNTSASTTDCPSFDVPSLWCPPATRFA